MTVQELNAELRRVRLETLIESLTEWAAEETNPVCGDRWCEGFAAGHNSAKGLIKDLLENLSSTI
jgi:hypothetical protein